MQDFLYRHIVQPTMFAFPPETAHGLTLTALRLGLAGGAGVITHPALAQDVWGLNFPNPLGMAAGFDKKGEATLPLFGLGFGAVEIGTVTPLPQPGNPKPRVFRDIAAAAIINRMGFPGTGLEKLVRRVRRLRALTPLPGILGINLGKNKDQADPVADYLTGMRATHKIADYWTINVSSPNTPGLRDLQQRGVLTELLAAAQNLRTALAPNIPLLLKISPDLTDGELADVVSVAMAQRISGMIITNTTLARPAGLDPTFAAEKGGLSGKPLMDISTRMLREVWRATGGTMPLIGVGGVDNAATAYAKIRAGANLVQVYTGLVYAGPGLIPPLLDGVVALLKRDGFTHLREAIGQH